MLQATCKDNVVVTASNNMIHCSNGDCYVLNGQFLSGPGAANVICASLSEAFGMVIGMHGGRKF